MTLVIRKPTENRYCKALFFAPAGAGKTVLMGTAELDERTSPMLLLDFEGGTESLAGLDVDIAEIKTWEDYNEAYELLSSGDHNYKSVGIDSISETHKWALLTIVNKKGPTRKEPDLIEQGDYGVATTQMRRMLRHFRDLPMHVFFVAHAKEIEIPREGRVRVPDLAGQMAEEVSGLVSVQGYLAQFEEDGKLHRTLLLHSFPRYRIKARTPWEVVVPEELIDPTVTQVLDALQYGESRNGFVANASSSRGKHVEEEVPKDDAVDPEDRVDEDPEVPQNQEEDSVPYDEMTLPALRAEAKERGIDLAGARTRDQIIERLRDADSEGDGDDGDND